ncbi:MAG: hypothetical protein FWD35_01685 [Oscillospiraceae bacterium]|nr:hypothetical protein [Oscillospiraceae bacterium]
MGIFLYEPEYSYWFSVYTDLEDPELQYITFDYVETYHKSFEFQIRLYNDRSIAPEDFPMRNQSEVGFCEVLVRAAHDHVAEELGYTATRIDIREWHGLPVPGNEVEYHPYATVLVTHPDSGDSTEINVYFALVNGVWVVSPNRIE